MKRLLLTLMVVVVLSPVGYAFAAITAPDSISINTISAFRNLAEDGDVAIMFHYSMPYASDNYSTTPASQSTVFTLKDTDNVTILQTGAPYVTPLFGSNGYGEGVGAFYFSAADNFTWNAAVTINIAGLPNYYEKESNSPPLTLSDYVSATTQEANRLLMKDYILLECDKLTASYSDTGVVLKATSDVGSVLSGYGESYFRGVVPGLQDLVPALFYIQSLTPEQMAVVDYDMSLGDTYGDRLATDDLGKGFTRMGDLIGVSGSFFSAIIMFAGTIVLCVWANKKGWRPEIGLLGGGLLTVLLALLVGDTVFTVMMIAALVAAIGIIWLTLLKKA